MLLSIVILNYNTFKLTCDCIQSIKDTARNTTYEVVLIDNNSKECSPEEFLKVFPEVNLIAIKENIGYSRAKNKGFEAAKGKYILSLDSDTLVYENTIDETIEYMEKNPQADILGCKVFTNGGQIQGTTYPYKGELSFFRSIPFFIKRNTILKELIRVVYNWVQKRKKAKLPPGETSMESKEVVQSKEEKWKQITPNYVDGTRIGSLVGCFLLLKRSVYEETKGFDPDFFMYHEELEWFLNRLRKYNAVYYPYVSIMHFYSGSNIYNKMSLQLHVSHYLFWYKMSKGHLALFFLFNLVEIPCKLIMSVAKWDRWYFTDIGTVLKAFPYALFDIPRYSNKYGSRKDPLKLNFLRKRGL
jgi:GT2 family glycosyltransferase